MRYKEWSGTRHHTGCFVPESKIQAIIENAPDPGYASVYSFIERPDSAVGLSAYTVFADCVTLDLDGGDEELAKVEAILAAHGYAYEVYTSGGKGYHVTIPHEGIESNDLPYSHSCWVADHGLPCDLTLYQHGRILALPGRIHPTTKNKKTFVKKIDGRVAEVELRQTPPIEVKIDRYDRDLLKYAVLRLGSLVCNGPEKNDRHMSLWKAAKDFRRLGWSQETVFEVLLSVNDSWPNPKTEAEVMHAVKGAFKC